MRNKQSDLLLKRLLDDFDPAKDRPNKKYLETQITLLNRMVYTYRQQSTNPKFSTRNRAMARDMEQNCLGLINGISFALSFLEHQDVDLSKDIN
jgi:hypothetical protein